MSAFIITLRTHGHGVSSEGRLAVATTDKRETNADTEMKENHLAQSDH